MLDNLAAFDRQASSSQEIIATLPQKENRHQETRKRGGAINRTIGQ